MTVLAAGICTLAPWRPDHTAALVAEANDAAVSANLRNTFPYPYRPGDAADWIAGCLTEDPVRNFAILVDDVVVGGVGLNVLDEVEAGTAEIGYWLGRRHWGKGIATAALTALTGYAFATFDLRRIHAAVYSWNPASARVLEKAGYVLEGRLREAVVKRGRVGDVLVYARLRSETISGRQPPVTTP